MREIGRLGAGVLAFVLMCSGSYAAGYDAYVRAMGDLSAGLYAKALESFDEALKAGDLAPAYVSTVRMHRAQLYMQSDRCQEARTDLDGVLALKPNDPDALVLRAAAKICLGAVTDGEADFSAAVALRQTAAMYDSFARILWANGHFDAAAPAFGEAAARLKPDDTHKPYAVLWYAISAKRAGRLDEAVLKAGLAKRWFDTWPTPILKYFLGTISQAEVYRFVADKDTPPQAPMTCEANFYIGEWHLAQGDAADALKKIETAANTCPKTFVEFYGANTELHRKTPSKK